MNQAPAKASGRDVTVVTGSLHSLGTTVWTNGSNGGQRVNGGRLSTGVHRSRGWTSTATSHAATPSDLHRRRLSTGLHVPTTTTLSFSFRKPSGVMSLRSCGHPLHNGPDTGMRHTCPPGAFVTGFQKQLIDRGVTAWS